MVLKGEATRSIETIQVGGGVQAVGVGVGNFKFVQCIVKVDSGARSRLFIVDFPHHVVSQKLLASLAGIHRQDVGIPKSFGATVQRSGSTAPVDETCGGEYIFRG